MKTTRFALAALAAFTLALAVGCGGPLEADLGDQAATTDAGAKPDASGGEGPAPGCNPAVLDCDGDGRVGSADCLPYDETVYKGAVEACNGKDDNCSGQIDEGCPAQPQPPAGNQPVDADGDGFWTLTVQPDCNDQNPKVKPGVAEDCNTPYDDNCNGQTNEGCPGGVTPPTPNGDVLKCTFSWPSNGSRTANYQVVDHKSELFAWWHNPTDPPQTGTSVTFTSAHVEDGICGFRLNTHEAALNQQFCMGNGATATLHPNIGVSCTYKGMSATKANLVSVSEPKSPAQGGGCSAYWRILTHPDCP